MISKTWKIIIADQNVTCMEHMRTFIMQKGTSIIGRMTYIKGRWHPFNWKRHSKTRKVSSYSQTSRWKVIKDVISLFRTVCEKLNKDCGNTVVAFAWFLLFLISFCLPSSDALNELYGVHITARDDWKRMFEGCFWSASSSHWLRNTSTG